MARDGEGPAPAGPRRRSRPVATVAVAVTALVAVLLAVGLVSVVQGWALTHPPRQPVRGDPPTEVSLVYRCLPFVLPGPCGPRPLFTPGQHIPIWAWILPYGSQPYPNVPQNWSAKTVVLVPDHGQSRTPDNFPVWSVAKLLNAAGYNVVLFDPRGQGLSGGAGIGFGTIEVRDLLTVVNYLHVLGGPPQGEIAVWGVGTGADTALLAAARDPRISAVIADSPYLSAGSYLRRRIPVWTGLPAFPFSESILWAMQEETGIHYGRYDVRAAAARLGTRPARPLLIVVGSRDTVTPPAEAEALFQAAGSRAYIYPVPGAGHLQGYGDSPPDHAAPGFTEYQCLVLNTLQVMGSSTGNAAPAGPGGPCGGQGAGG